MMGRRHESSDTLGRGVSSVISATRQVPKGFALAMFFL